MGGRQKEYWEILLIEESFQDSEIKRIVIDAQLGYSFFLVEALDL